MTIVYKLTDANGRSHGATQWGAGVSHSGTGEGELCGPGWVHAYTDPLLAVLLNPIHANFSEPRLWEAEGSGRHLADHGLKVGYETLTTIRELPLPEVTTEQRVRFAILCAQRVCDDPAWSSWADAWLSGKDRSKAEAAEAWAAWAAAAEAAAAWAAPLDLIAIAREAVA